MQNFTLIILHIIGDSLSENAPAEILRDKSQNQFIFLHGI